MRILPLALSFVVIACACVPARADDASFARAMQQLSAAKDDYARWCALGFAAKENLNQGFDMQAKSFAEELEQLAPKHLKDWNYGNAIQDSNIVLGRLALKAGDIEEAKRRLLSSGQSKGSPQMNSFGPNMTLAKDLLIVGEREVVLAYFRLCKAFWGMERGRLDAWSKDVEEGRTPDFGANLVY
jgi:hypothetical protein